jgi:hypothetical protein
MKTNPTTLAVRERVNLAVWINVVLKAWRAEPDGERKEFLRAMHKELIRRVK